MSEQTTASFIQLLEQIADNKYILGDRLVEVGISGPDLEATLGAIAMAQGELGHARLLYNWALDLKGHKGKRSEISSQTGKAFPTVIAVSNWIELIASVYVINLASELVLKELLQSNLADVVYRIHKLVKEQTEHIVYSRNWVEQLFQDGGTIPKYCQKALADVSIHAEQWLRSVEESTELVAGGYLQADVKLVEKFQEQLAKLEAKRTAAHVN